MIANVELLHVHEGVALAFTDLLPCAGAEAHPGQCTAPQLPPAHHDSECFLHLPSAVSLRCLMRSQALGSAVPASCH